MSGAAEKRNVMFTYVVQTGNEEKDEASTRLRGAKEVLETCLDEYGSQEEDDIFVRMMWRGVIAVAVILFSVRRFDVA